MESKDKQPLTKEQLYEKYKCIVKNFNVSIGGVVIKESFLKALGEVSSPLLTRIAEQDKELQFLRDKNIMRSNETAEAISSANKLAEALEKEKKAHEETEIFCRTQGHEIRQLKQELKNK